MVGEEERGLGGGVRGQGGIDDPIDHCGILSFLW